MNDGHRSMLDIAPTISSILRIPTPARSRGKSINAIAYSFSGSDRVAVLVPDALGSYAWSLWQAKHKIGPQNKLNCLPPLVRER